MTLSDQLKTFAGMDKVPPVINDIPNEQLQQVKYVQKRYKTTIDYGTF